MTDSTRQQYNPSKEHNDALLSMGLSKIVYALVTPQTERAKETLLGDSDSVARADYMNQFRAAWTQKQDSLHEQFFSTWMEWASPVIRMDSRAFLFHYPTAGASEALRHLIYDFAAKGGRYLHVFRGEYEGFGAMAEAAGLTVISHQRNDAAGVATWFRVNLAVENPQDRFFISQPSAIDGNVWEGFNEFVSTMPPNSIVADLTYVGSIPSVRERFFVDAPSVRNIVFSLSKPFGTYYDRIGGVFFRKEDAGLFGNKWFKNLTSLSLGVRLLQGNGVFDIPRSLVSLQAEMVARLNATTGSDFSPSDVVILATAPTTDESLAQYLTRNGTEQRVCLTPGMAAMLGTAEDRV